MDNQETVQVPWLLTEGARLPFTSDLFFQALGYM